jgi:DNA-binding NtrC family response regulator
MEDRSILLLEFESNGEPGNTLRQILESWPARDFKLTCHTAESFDANNTELFRLILREKPLLVVLALGRVQLQSLDVLLPLLGPSPPPIVVVVEADQEELVELMRPGVADFIITPLRASEALVRFRRLLNQVDQERRTQQILTQKLGLQQLIGQSPIFLTEMEKIPTVAKSDTTVLVLGETGTGKEVVGRTIHYLSPRAGQPFVPVNCGAIPVELVENELFGHKREAFTGATGSRSGLIQEAEHGTLFLDEVNALPLMAQVKLLRFLQSKEYRALGSTKSLHGDVRIIAASNADLEAEVAAGTMRRDLYYRLNVVPIVLPPLRTRSTDIILFARHFLAQYAAKLNSPAVTFSPEAERKLLLYSWPGNVRELEHVIERAVVFGTTKVIHENQMILPGENTHKAQLSFQEMKAKVVSQFEIDYIQSLLAAYGGNISKAAQAARKERRTFWELVRKHKIDVQKFRVAYPSEAISGLR